MDQSDTLTARTVVNEVAQEELRRIFSQYEGGALCRPHCRGR